MSFKEKIIKKLMSVYRKIEFDQKKYFDNIAIDYFKNCKKILDLGCGDGRFISLDPKRIIGLDHNEKSVQICKNKGFDVKYGEVTNIPFKDNFFDGVHCSHVIEHLFPKDAHKLLFEVNRVLKKNGIFILRTPLLHSKFYCDLTHIKPYYPEAILHYLKTEDQNQRTLSDIVGIYKILKLKYRRAPLFANIDKNSFFFFLVPFFNFLYRLKISSFKRTGYMLILKKIK